MCILRIWKCPGIKGWKGPIGRSIHVSRCRKCGFEEENDEFNFGLCDMAGKLMTGMCRVADGDFGGVRCLNKDGTTATGAYLHVDNPDGTEFIHINIIDSNANELVEEL